MPTNLTSEPIDAPSFDRRAMLGAGVAGLATLLLATKADAKTTAKTTKRRRKNGSGFDPLTCWLSATGRLVRRVTYGGTEADFRAAHDLGYEAYLQQQIAYTSINDDGCESWLKQNISTYGMNNYHLACLNPTTRWNLVLSDMQREALFRAIYSKRQLYERMVEFWTDHFNVNYGTVGPLLLPYIRDAIRKNAMGRFSSLLLATGQSAAMLEYLSTNYSVKSDPNQNYAREVMELHTLGIGQYTQLDVVQAARCFTGWTFDGVTQHPTYGNFYFNESQHDQGQKTLFAATPEQLNIAAGSGLQDGAKLLSALANHPKTAYNIASKLCSWFLGDNVPETTITSVARVFIKYDGYIPLVLQEVLKSENVLASGVKFKRPFHLVASAVRTTQSSAKPQQAVKMLDWLANMVYNMGQPMFQWPEPNGYPDIASYWMVDMLPRLSNSFDFLTWGQTDLVTFPAAVGAQSSPADVVDSIDAMLFNNEISPALRVELDAVLHPLFNNSWYKYRLRSYAFSLALTSLDFQYF